MIGNHFYPQQKLVSKVRDGAKVTKKYDTAKGQPARKPHVNDPATRTFSDEATKQRSRTS